jgi:hypothetical protein
MRVRATSSFLIGDRGFPSAVNEGDELELPDPAAVELLRAGHVERVASIPEVAALNRGEKAVRHARPVR